MYEDWLNDASDEEVDKAFDGLVEAYQEFIDANSGTAILNPSRFSQMKLAYGILEKLTAKMDGVKLKYTLNEPFQTMGDITLEGNSIEFFSSKWFSKVAELASNLEVYPLANGQVRLTFTFHGIAVPAN